MNILCPYPIWLVLGLVTIRAMYSIHYRSGHARARFDKIRSREVLGPFYDRLFVRPT